MPAGKRIRSTDGFSDLHARAMLIPLLLALCTPLPAAQPGEVVEEVCLTCHNPIAVMLQKKFTHRALEGGCLACHLDCREITPTSNRHKVPAHYLKTEEPGLCLGCHTPEEEDLAVVHRDQLFAEAKCSSCHEPHGSNSEKRIPDFSHGPFAVRDCAACHAPPVDGKVKLVAPNIEELCNGCHLEIKTLIEKAKYRHNIVSRKESLIKSDSSCVECHDAHATNQEYFLKDPEPELCERCHRNLTAGMKYIHGPVKMSCVFCHDAHASDIANDLYEPVHQLCLECHGENVDKIRFSSKPFLLFEGRVELLKDSFERLKPLRLSKNGTGHPVEGHPVYVPAGDNTPELNCLSCHRAHADASSPQLLTESKLSLCQRCHDK